MRIAAMLSVCTLLLQLPATAQVYWDFKTAYGAYDRGDFELAADMYKRLAASGDIRAQNELGFLHSVGQGVPQDDGKAAEWYRLAANAGYPPAQSSLAHFYAIGRGVARDDMEAHKWFNLAGILHRNANARRVAAARRNEVARRLGGAKLATARKRACVWLESRVREKKTDWTKRTPSYCTPE
ncbi:MAG: sel1 repeat family protein [Rhodospirillaceae bacterium]|jgi:uncharacterized protein|nr:sel1 repeat family protein [Rhodospirillaceae bacterium]